MTAHPDWCSLARCTAVEGGGAHRGQPAIVEDVVVSLFADAGRPDVTLIEIRCGVGVLTARTAFIVGTTLRTLAKQANGGAR